MGARSDYEARLAGIRSELLGLESRWNRVAALRAAAFTAFAVFVILALMRGGLWAVAAAVGLVAFGGCVAWHARLAGERATLRRLGAWHERSLERLAGHTDPEAPGGKEFLDEHHPYAAELDLFGADSLFSWICHAQSGGGRHRLARWLNGPARADEILRRQAAVAELRDDARGREDMLLCAARVPPREALVFQRWAENRSPAEGLALLRWVSFLLAVTLSGALVAWLAFGASVLWFLALSFVAYGWVNHGGKGLRSTMDGLENARAELGLLRGLLVHVEHAEFECEKLRAVQSEICRFDVAASKRVAALERRLDFHEAARNALFAPLAALLLWQLQWAASIEAWRRAHAAELVGALDALFEYEALQSLARLAYERPCVAPAVLEDGVARIRMEAAGHPLLPGCVPNDLSLGGAEPSIWMISGSNMSGKSTFLRSAGVNLVLAMAGGHVLAARMEFSPVVLGASIRAGDSLSSGESRFAHELARLRLIMSSSEGDTPVCFLLDELLHGTHSHDRRIGADAILRKLAARGALGLVTTHDLALCEIKAPLEGVVRNVHFQDDVVDGEASFDYSLRDGVVEKSNALRLMRAAGLIDDD